MKSPLLTAFLLIAFPLVCVVLALWYILYWNTSNHGVYFLPILWPLSACLLFAVYKYFRKKRRAYIVSLCVNALAIMFFIGVDKFNIMLDYDVWAGRGMPGRFEKSVQQPKNKVHKPTLTKEEIEDRDKDAIKIYGEHGRLRGKIYKAMAITLHK
jgi:hypothetical protein